MGIVTIEPEFHWERGVVNFITQDDVETHVFDWGTMKRLVEPRGCDAKRLSRGVSVILPRKSHARHNHGQAEERLYILVARGRQLLEDASGTPCYRYLGPGDMVYVPIGRYYETNNFSWEPLKCLVTFSPQGSEALITSLADERIPAPGAISPR